jgi:hypothetical protein
MQIEATVWGMADARALVLLRDKDQSFQVVRLADRARGPTRQLIVIRATTRAIRKDDLDHSAE